MSHLNHLPIDFNKRIKERSLFKVIAGLNNFDQSSVARIARAARHGGADLLDVACDPDVVRLALEVSGLPICVSAVEPHLFEMALDAGASMVEIGNFDSFYPQGRFFEGDEVLELTRLTRRLLPKVPLSVTVPHILSLDKQAQLAVDLVDSGADFIQTEGGTSSRPLSPGSLGMIEKAAPTLAATHSIVETFNKNGCCVPVLSASGLSAVTVPMAIATGAHGVGVGSAINRLNDELAMVAAVHSLREAIDSAKCLISCSF